MTISRDIGGDCRLRLMPVTIYFAGAISGGRGDVRHYRAIVESLARAGHRVLAGAVASEEVGEEGEALDPAAICARDLRWIGEADVLVAEVSTPSTGVGYEIAAARYRFLKPVICLYRASLTQRCSAMVAGDSGIELITYAEMPEMLVRLHAALAKYSTATAG
jgi:hypothetical protein